MVSEPARMGGGGGGGATYKWIMGGATIFKMANWSTINLHDGGGSFATYKIVYSEYIYWPK